MGHSKSRLVEDADESAPVRLESRYIPDTSGQAGQARTYPDNKFTSPDLSGCSTSRHLPRASGIYRGDRKRGAKVSIYF